MGDERRYTPEDVKRAFNGGDEATMIEALRQDGYEIIAVFDAACAWADSGRPVTDGSAGRLAATIDRARSELNG